MIENMLNSLSRLLQLLCAFFFVVMGISLTLQIFSRYFMAQSIFWTEELARYAMVWLVFLGVVVASSQHAHTRIDFFVDLFPTMGRKAVKILVNSACLLFLAGITYHSTGLLNLGMIMKSSALKIPMIFVYASLPFSCGLVAIYIILESYHILKGDAVGSDGEGDV